MQSKIIKIKNLNFQYEHTNDENIKKIYKVLKNINLDINEGEFISIIGQNGSGKSTLAKMLNGLLLPTSGDVEIFGINTKDEKRIFDIRKNVGMVFQNPDNQIVASVVKEDVAFGLENIAVPTEEMKKRVDEALTKMDLIKFKNSSPMKLSGGQKQKLALCGIFAMMQKVIVLDEPTSMLDTKGRQEVINTLIKLNKEYNITIILITHYLEEIMNSDRILVMGNGEILKVGTKEEIFSDETLEDIGIELPTIIKIKNDLINRGIHLSDKIYTVEDMMLEL